MNETIINGIDVSECRYLNKVVNEEPYCNIDEEHLCTCSSDKNCYFKQLKRLQEENEELKEMLSKEPKAMQAFQIAYSGNKKENETLWGMVKDYKTALEETLKILCNGRTFYEGYFDNPNLSRTDEAIKVINEVLK